MRLRLIFLAVLLELFMINGPALAAGWSGSQTATVEPGATGTTTCIEYSVTENWMADLVFDWHSVKGPAYDLSTTIYFHVGNVIYATTGVKFTKTCTPYLSVTYQF
jgi:hypothetical protein